VLAGLSGASVCLGTAFQRPGLLAASAAWDPDAAAALCILAMASDANDPAADPDELPTCLRMRPALADCLRHVQADLQSVHLNRPAASDVGDLCKLTWATGFGFATAITTATATASPLQPPSVVVVSCVVICRHRRFMCRLQVCVGWWRGAAAPGGNDSAVCGLVCGGVHPIQRGRLPDAPHPVPAPLQRSPQR
jgi:hypothetical protein